MKIEARGVSFRYSAHSPLILNGVDLEIEAGERVALTGPSGCGKSTLAKLLAGYLKPTAGEVLWDGKPLPKSGYMPVQLIGQHPELAVNPRWKMSRILNECWTPDHAFLERMGIEKEWLSRWPAELSGGELQRFCIARVLGPPTKFLVCDEISTMLDAITQAQIWEVLLRVSQEQGIGLLVITHSLPLAEKVCDRVVEVSEGGVHGI
ncbi:MAG: ATP-binding cassette domain-containing protein [Clostridiales Family XIII bacterium]|nr:ATP-binding cassette domain-containing protein [Clostridiales Family XIII bacterium]